MKANQTGELNEMNIVNKNKNTATLTKIADKKAFLTYSLVESLYLAIFKLILRLGKFSDNLSKNKSKIYTHPLFLSF